MACCCCFSEEPPEHLEPNDFKYKYYHTHIEKFDIALDEAPGKEPCYCCYAAVCMPCALYQLRASALSHYNGTEENWAQSYRCCQDYFPCPCIPCFDPCVNSCPHATLFCETCCCPGWSVSATRFLIMDQYNLGMHPIDNQIIRCNNAVQLLACVCNTLAICIRPLREAARLVQCVADLVFVSTAGCMAGQVMHEIKLRTARKEGTGSAYQAPVVAEATPISEESGLLPDKQEMNRA